MRRTAPVQLRGGAASEGEGMGVGGGEVVDDAGDFGMELAAAEVFGGDDLARGSLNELDERSKSACERQTSGFQVITGGPARKIVPWFRTMMLSSAIAGT